ncbi:unnamed protein product [Scytosiphon promiscuus]
MREFIALVPLMLFFSLVTVFGSPTEMLHSHADGLSKTVFSDKMRVIFLVGLEGVGHHYLRLALSEASQKLPNLIQEASACNCSWQSGTISQYIADLDLARQQMQSFAQVKEGLQEGQAKLVHFVHCVSYPYSGGVHKVFQYTDLRMLADLAEEGGVDFRVVYLRRSAGDMVVADTVHRQFANHLDDGAESSSEEQFVWYLKVLFADMGVMHSLLSELDPAFVVCHDYSALGNPDQAKEIATFIAPNEDMAQQITTSLVATAQEKHAAGSSSLPLEGAEVIVDRMQRKLDAFEGIYCGL